MTSLVFAVRVLREFCETVEAQVKAVRFTMFDADTLTAQGSRQTSDAVEVIELRLSPLFEVLRGGDL